MWTMSECVGLGKKWDMEMESFALLAVGKVLSWLSPQSLFNSREGFSNSGCGGDGGKVF